MTKRQKRIVCKALPFSLTFFFFGGKKYGRESVGFGWQDWCLHKTVGPVEEPGMELRG